MKKIAIIGASYLQLPLVLKAKELGLEVHCFAWEIGAVCKNIADFFYPISVIDKDKIFDICNKIGISGITSIASDIAVPTISYVAEKLDLVSNTYKDALTTTNKYEMRKIFIKHNVACPQFTTAKDNYSIDGFKFPLIIKPTDRSGSLGVMKVQTIQELEYAIKRAKNESFENQCIIEEYITGAEVSVETISWQGIHYILSITDKVTTGEPYFVELEHHQPSLLNIDIQQKIKTETIKALDSLNIRNGASHSEFKITNDGQIFAIEVSGRMGGDFIGSDLVYRSTGYDFLKGVINISLGIFEKPFFTQTKSAGVLFLCKETEYLLPVFENNINRKEIIKIERTDKILRHIQCSSDRSGYLIYQSDNKFNI